MNLQRDPAQSGWLGGNVMKSCVNNGKSGGCASSRVWHEFKMEEISFKKRKSITAVPNGTF